MRRNRRKTNNTPLKHVKVYRNLRNNCFSIQDRSNGLVESYSKFIYLKEVSFSVNENARQKVLEKKQKSVHAYMSGEIVTEKYVTEHILKQNLENYVFSENLLKVNYNPYANGHWYEEDERSPVNYSEIAIGYVNPRFCTILCYKPEWKD